MLFFEGVGEEGLWGLGVGEEEELVYFVEVGGCAGHEGCQCLLQLVYHFHYKPIIPSFGLTSGRHQKRLPSLIIKFLQKILSKTHAMPSLVFFPAREICFHRALVFGVYHGRGLEIRGYSGGEELVFEDLKLGSKLGFCYIFMLERRGSYLWLVYLGYCWGLLGLALFHVV